MIKTLLFDIYQTLVDVDVEQKNIHKAWNLFDTYIANLGKSYIGTPFEQLVKVQENKYYEGKNREVDHRDFKESIREAFNNYYKVGLEDRELEKLIWEFRTKSRDYYNVYPKVKDTLKKLANKYTLATASIAHGSFTMRELEELGIKKYFSYFIFSSNTGYKKPAREFYDVVLKQTNSQPHETIMIGDNLHQDIWGAQQLNIWTILMANPITLKFDSQIIPNEIVPTEHFDRLEKAIEKIEQKAISF